MSWVQGARVIVIGAGISGLSTSIRLARCGAVVRLVDMRGDPSAIAGNHPSFNLTLGVRGMRVLEALGIGGAVRRSAVFALERCLHRTDGTCEHERYGRADEGIYSIRRSALLGELLSLAQQESNIELQFGARATSASADGLVGLSCADGSNETAEFDAVIGADGVNSSVRGFMSQLAPSVLSSARPTGIYYSEIYVGLGAECAGPLVHIWPRSPSFLISFPNRSGPTTVLVFIDRKGAQRPSKADVLRVARAAGVGSGLVEADLGQIAQLRTVQSSSWSSGRLVVIGDAAHAIVPFLGQGANAALEDSEVLLKAIKEAADWTSAFERFELVRRTEMDALGRMADRHFDELSGGLVDPDRRQRTRLRAKLSVDNPGSFRSTYNAVAFTHSSYLAAEQAYQEEEAQIDRLLTQGRNR
ncbi:FAD-dependent oxidoreductase [Kribbella sp. NPDC051587]|uniref:FAD-dependent oxidoreductase n=1 Tax=Kribbella sp. NPDC051587 TaxID=3364119 RepID=UPI0037A9721E